MTAVLVFDQKVAIPDGWLVVRGGLIREGDRWTCQIIGAVAWVDVPERYVGRDSMSSICVIRRDPGAEA